MQLAPARRVQQLERDQRQAAETGDLPTQGRRRQPVEGSQAVLRKCGYVREAWLRKSVWKDGQLIDSAMYAKLRP